jgi:hypothetical protein
VMSGQHFTKPPLPELLRELSSLTRRPKNR